MIQLLAVLSFLLHIRVHILYFIVMFLIVYTERHHTVLYDFIYVCIPQRYTYIYIYILRGVKVF